MNALVDPRRARSFRFVRARYADGVAELVYAFDDGPELVETIRFADAPVLPAERQRAFQAALHLLHLIAGVSYYKAGVPDEIRVDSGSLNDASADLMDTLYRHGLAEFAYRNKLDLQDRIRFPRAREASLRPEQSSPPASPAPPSSGLRTPSSASVGRENEQERLPAGEEGRGAGATSRKATDATSPAPALGLAQRTLIPIGGGKDSLVAIEAIKRMGGDATVAWIGHSPLIAHCAERTGLPMLNIGRELSPILFEYNRMGAWNGHVPVTAVNSAILIVAAVLYGFDSIAFANERSASAATLEYEGQQVNHQWSKGFDFERRLQRWVHAHVAADLDYCSLLRPFAELAVTRAFARLGVDYFDAFSSCNRNFRILGPRPADRWCGQCPKCHFVFLALAPFVAKPRLLSIFGRNLLDDEEQRHGFDALMEYHEHKPFECVGEAAEARAAMYTLSQRPEWAEDTLIRRFVRDILPQLDARQLALQPWLEPSGEHCIPDRLAGALDEIRHA